MNLPELEGSELQVKWAKSLRAKATRQIESLSRKEIAQIIDKEIKPEALQPIVKGDPIKAVQFLRAVVQYALSCPSAQWWIKNKEDNPVSWIPNAARVCANHYTKHSL